jgi:hypothetical protein
LELCSLLPWRRSTRCGKAPLKCMKEDQRKKLDLRIG